MVWECGLYNHALDLALPRLSTGSRQQLGDDLAI